LYNFLFVIPKGNLRLASSVSALRKRMTQEFLFLFVIPEGDLRFASGIGGDVSPLPVISGKDRLA
jgi:hypothetical protein